MRNLKLKNLSFIPSLGFLFLACSQEFKEPSRRNISSQTNTNASESTDNDANSKDTRIDPPHSAPNPIPTSSPTPVASDTPPVPPTPIAKPIMLISGNDGRSMLSCDDGKSWRHQLQAYVTGDQFHSSYAHTSTVYTNGKFYTTLGWNTGLPFVTFRISDDGVNWIERTDLGTGYIGVASTSTSMAAFASYGQPRRSIDQGATWTPVSFYNGDHIRMFSGIDGHYFGIGGQRSDGTANIVISRDDGASYVKHTGFNGLCTKSPGGLAMNSATWLITNSSGHACATTDKGLTFMESQVLGIPDYATNIIRSNTIWGGSHFYMVGTSSLYKSTDGVSWEATAHPFNTGWGVILGHNTLTDTVIAMMRIGASEYMIYRSENKGASWTLAARNVAVMSYFKKIDFGYTQNPAVCD